MEMHTATPLEAKRVDSAHAVVNDANGFVYTKLSGNEQAFERAEFIAKCVNAHDDLVAALHKILATENCDDSNYSRIILAALDKAGAA